MNLLAIMLNENGSIFNGQGIKLCSGNNGSSFGEFQTCLRPRWQSRLGLLEWILPLRYTCLLLWGNDFFSHIVEMRQAKV